MHSSIPEPSAFAVASVVWPPIAWAITAGLLSAALTALAWRYALRRQLLDLPGRRRSHRVPTPRGGGIGIAAAAVLGALGLALTSPSERVALAGFMGGLAAVAAIGAFDDHRPQSVRLRLGIHALAAAGFVLAAFGPPHDIAGAAAGVLAIVALVGMTNIWNFMDGIDGLAASQAAIVTTVLAVALWPMSAWSLLALIMAGATLGFLPFNAPRARIFLGDIGSGVLGFGCGALLLVAGTRDALAWSSTLLLICAFGLDAGLTLLLRILRGKRWWHAHREHLYQWWVRGGRSHAQVTAAYAAWTLGCVCVIAASAGLPVAWKWLLTAVLLSLGAGLWCIMKRRFLDRTRTRLRGVPVAGGQWTDEE